MDDDQHNDRNEERPHIKVTDRRKFRPDGSPRESPSEPAAAPPESPPAEIPIVGDRGTATPPQEAADGGAEPAANTAAESPAATPSAEPPAATPPAEPPASTPPAEPPPIDPGEVPAGGPATRIADLPRDFTAFVEGMYLESMLYLGAIPDPRTGEVAEDLEMAKYKIDLLGLLQEKTKGNLTSEESQQLEEVLYQVRMFYVQKTEKKP